uniref:Uncharacterized protein n=1 Tax=Arundo donax TaxID=35708 RepID=A0A0A8Z013_ARUDO
MLRELRNRQRSLHSHNTTAV